MKKLLLSLFVVLASGGYAVSQSGKANLDDSANFTGADRGASAATLAPVSTGPNAQDAATPSILQVSAPSQSSGPAPSASLPKSPAPAPAPTPLAEIATPSPPASPTPSVKPVGIATLITSNPVPSAATPPALPPTPQSVAPIPSPVPPFLAQRRALFLAANSGSGHGQYRDGNYRGSVDNAYYGLVQVEAEIQGGRLIAVRILQYPNDRRTSRYIAHHSLPILNREAIRAQSARIDTVSGATLTSRAYIRSLRDALAGAGSTQSRT